MAAKSSAGPGILAILSLGLGLAAAFAAGLEAAPYTSAGITMPQKSRILESGEIPAGLSVASKMLLLGDCRALLKSVYGRTLRTERRRDLLQACAVIARHFTDDASSFSYAWYLGALAAAELGDVETFNRSLKMSHQTGPNEQWIGELRVDLAEDHRAMLGPATAAYHEGDLAMLVRSRRGIGAIARRYVTVPDFRGRITDIVEQMSASDQQRFLTTLQHEIRKVEDGDQLHPDRRTAP